MVCESEFVLRGAGFDLLGRSQQPAAVLTTLKSLARTINGIDHQQITPFRQQLLATTGKQLLF